MTKVLNLKSEQWSVLNDNSDLFYDTVLKWLKDNMRMPETALLKYSGVALWSDSTSHWQSSIAPFGTLLTLSEFIELSTEWKPVKGEEIEVSDNDNTWCRANFVVFADGDDCPYIVRFDGSRYPVGYKRARKIEQPKPTVTLTINGIETDIKTMTDAELLALKNS